MVVSGNRMPLPGNAQVVFASYALGIVLSRITGMEPSSVGIVTLLLLLSAVCALRTGRFGGVLVLAVVCTSGMTAQSIQHAAFERFEPRQVMVNRLVSVAGTIEGTPRIEGGTTSCTLSCDSLYFQGARYISRGIVAVSAGTDSITLFEGDRIVVRGILRKRPEPIAGTWSRLNGYQPVPYRITGMESENNFVIVESQRDLFGILRQSVAKRISRFRFGGYSGLFAAMTIAETSRLDRALRQRFANAGMAHLLAVSGLHAAIVISVLGGICSLLITDRRVRAFLLILGIIVYAGICGFRPPVVRAAIMCGMVMTGRLLERRLDGEHMLAIAGLIILAFDPSALFGLSFQLSFVAVWSIVSFYSVIREQAMRWLPVACRRNALMTKPLSLLLVSFLAVLGTAPVVAATFGTLPLLSVPVNMFAVPIAYIILIAGGSAVAVSFAGPIGVFPAIVCDTVAGWFLHALVWLGDRVSSLPFATIDTGMVTPFLALSMLVWLYVLSRAPGRPSAQRLLIYLPISILTVTVWMPIVFPAAGDIKARTVFFDVGQGDAALVSSGSRINLLVDTGPPGAGRIVVESLDALGIRQLDGIVLSHFDADHAGGLNDIIDALPVDHVFCRMDAADSVRAVLTCPVTGLAAGDSLSFAGGGMVVLHPEEDISSTVEENDRSLVVRCDIGGMRLLFTGDIGGDIQREVVSWGDVLRSAVIKVPHHGSRPALDTIYMAADPQYAVISCGLNNSYGHPAPQTIAMLDNLGLEILETGRHGHIQITTGLYGFTVDVLNR